MNVMTTISGERWAGVRRTVIEVLGCAIAAIWFGLGTSAGQTLRLGVAGVVVACMVSVGIRAPARLILGTVAWLVLLGVVRRLVTVVGGSSGNDPLLLVAPFSVALLTVLAWLRGTFGHLTPMSRAVQILMVLILASVVNPLQGGIRVGMLGLLFTLVPLAWFWVGRAFVDDALLRGIFGVIAVAAVCAAGYGLTQTLLGFSGFDQSWIDNYGYPALRVQGTIRAFGPFVSASDYQVYLGVGFATLVGFATRPRWTLPCLAALALVGWALALGSGRGVVIQLAVALGMMLAAWKKMGVGRAALIGVALFGCLSLALGRVDTTTLNDPRTADLLAHQVKGLANPLSEEDSTLTGHVGLVGTGLTSSLSAPFGHGVGVMSQAADKLGGVSAGTESDPSNVSAGLGVPGLVAYLVLAGVAVMTAHNKAKSERTMVPLVALGILLVTGLQWFTGGNYAVAPIPWMVLGWLDRPPLARSEAAMSAMAEAPAISG